LAAKSTKKKNTTRKKAETKDTQALVRDEICLLAMLAFCILLCIGNFGFGGWMGELLSSFSFGIFGTISYAIPFLLFGIFAFLISNKGNHTAYRKVAATVWLSIMCMALFALFFAPLEGEKLRDYYQLGQTSHRGGGWLGGVIVRLLSPLVGVMGTYVIVVAMALIAIVMITEKSMLSPIQKGGRRAYEDARRRKDAYALQRAKRKEEARIQAESATEMLQQEAPKRGRRKQKVSGVSFATQLKESHTPVPDSTLHELSATKEEVVDEELLGDASMLAEPLPPVDSLFEDSSVQEQAEVMTQPPTQPKRKRKATKEEVAEVFEETKSVEERISISYSDRVVYEKPPLDLLQRGKRASGNTDAQLRATATKLEQTLLNFGVGVQVVHASCGPSVTRYELQPDQGVKVSKIVGLADDIKLNLAVTDLRIEAPIPGKAAVGIEVPNQENTAVMFRDLLESKEFRDSKYSIPFAVGKDIAGKTVVADIAKMPHLLVAGATGSGKSVCINTLIMSILYKASPQDVKLIMVDPKVVELSVYNGIPHLLIPVVTDPKKAAGALNWAVIEMEKRYRLFADYNVRDLQGFNEKVSQRQGEEGVPEPMPKIVIIVDELADLMMVAPGEVEGAICRLAQLARAAGLHLILATQRPSVNVITGLIKANMPSRSAFSVSSGVDSRTIIDMNGAEKLLGKGDMLFYPTGYPKPVRVQGSFVSDKEVQKVVEYLVTHHEGTSYNTEIEEQVNSSAGEGAIIAQGTISNPGNERDCYFQEAGELVIEKEKASIGMLQRMFKVGFNRASRIMDQLASAGVVGPEEGTKPRKILMTAEEFAQYLAQESA
jgi:S-DNA-T family DNA segregation ATPase FtsK/SpoIIIE